jgi:chromosome segregation ATPase
MDIEEKVAFINEKIKGARSKINVYTGEIERHKKRLEQLGMDTKNFDEQLFEIKKEIERLTLREEELLKKIETKLREIEERYYE